MDGEQFDYEKIKQFANLMFELFGQDADRVANEQVSKASGHILCVWSGIFLEIRHLQNRFGSVQGRTHNGGT